MWWCRLQIFVFYKSKYKKVGVLSIRLVKSNVSSVGPSSERNADQESTLETLDYTNRIGSTPTFLYFDLYILYNLFQYINHTVITN